MNDFEILKRIYSQVEDAAWDEAGRDIWDDVGWVGDEVWDKVENNIWFKVRAEVEKIKL